MNIVELLDLHVAARPDRPAIIDRRFGKDRVLTFDGLSRQVETAALRLRELGLRKGDKILSLLPVSAELYVLLLAAFRAELVVTLPDPSAGIERLAQVCARVRPEAVVYSGKSLALKLIAPVLRNIPLQLCTSHFHPLAQYLELSRVFGPTFAAGVRASRSLSGSGAFHDTVSDFCSRSDQGELGAHCMRSGTESIVAISLIDDVPALLSFTSGSTGEPKGIMRTQRFLAAQCEAVAQCTKPQPDAVQLVSLPVFVLANIANGVTSVIPDADLKKPGAILAGPVLRQLEDLNCSELLVSPAFLHQIVRCCLASGKTLPAVRKIFTGGAPVFGDLIEGASEVFPNAQCEIVYGSTEAEPIAHLRVADISSEDYRLMAQGRGLPAGEVTAGVAIAIVAEDSSLRSQMSEVAFAEVRKSDTMPGEILVSGDHVVKSYFWDSGDSVAKVEVNGVVWHRTGDSGFLDHSGRLWLLGRSSARVFSEEGTLYPFVVESLAKMEPGVQIAALLNSSSGTRTLAIQCLKKDRDAVKAGLSNLSARFAIAQIVCLDKLPVDGRHNSKVDYPALAKSLR